MKHPIPEFLKKAGLAAMLIIMPAVVFAQEETVTVLTKDGKSYEFAISGIDRINFNAQTIEMVGKSGNPKSMAYADINRILIGGKTSDIDNITADGNIAVYPHVTDGLLNIAGVEIGTEISIYDISGNLVKHTIAKDTAICLDIANAPTGMIIVQIGKLSTKIIKK